MTDILVAGDEPPTETPAKPAAVLPIRRKLDLSFALVILSGAIAAIVFAFALNAPSSGTAGAVLGGPVAATLLAVALGVTLLVAALLAIANHRIGVALRELARGTEAISGGDLAHRIDLAGNDEFARLAAAINEMSAGLGHSRELLIESNDYLVEEIEVRRRAETEQRRMREALEDSEARLHSILDNAPFAISLKDREHRYVLINRQYQTWYRMTPEQQLGRTLHDTSTDSEFSKVMEAMEDEVLATGEIQRREIREPDVGTAPTWELVTKFPVHGRDGTIIGVGTINLDTSVRRAAEEALRDNEERLRGLIDGVQDHAIYALDDDGHVASWNNGAARITGYAAEEVLGQPLSIFYAPPDRAIGEPANALAMARRTDFYSAEGWRLRKDGRRFWASDHLTALRSPAGALIGFSCITRDLTERTMAEEQRQTIIEASSNGILVIDQTGAITLANSAADRLFGYPRGAMHGLLMTELLPDWESAALGTGAAPAADATPREPGHALQGHALQGRTLQGKRCDGSELAIEIGLRTAETPRGQIRVATIVDVTARRAFEATLESARAAAEEANRAKSDFLASMSHEIRTPMNGVLGFAELLLGGVLTDEQRRQVTLLRDAGRSLLAIINDVLDVSKIEAGRLELESIATSPNEVVAAVVDLVRGQAAAKHLALEVRIADDVPAWIASDPTRLRQIILNLVSNALKFTERGEVAIAVSRQDRAGRTVLKVEVSDTGIGIPPQRQAALFQNFGQVDRSITRRFGGTGLGLAICKRLAEAMGGEIGLTSEPGIGSKFWFTIALVEATAAQSAEPRLIEVAPATQARILVAEDVYINQMIVEGLLKADGHEVVLVDDGAAALDAVQTGAFDLVLMDLEMPVMDGIAATRAIRALPSTVRTIPIVALTANAMVEEVARCKDAGMDDFLTKPIDRQTLLSAVARWSGNAARLATGSAASMPSCATIDEAALGDLEQRLGRAQVERFVTLFREQLDKTMRAIAATSDRAVIGREAHVLISLAGNLGCVELMARSRELSTGLKHDIGEIDPLIAALGDAAPRALAGLRTRYPDA